MTGNKDNKDKAAEQESKAALQSESRIGLDALSRSLRKLPKRNYNKDASSVTQFARLIAKKAPVMEVGIGKELGVKVSSTPTEWLAVWGPCLALGVSKEQLMKIFNPRPIEIRLYGTKYCALKFESTADASIAKAAKNATDYSDTQAMYLVYLSKAPPFEDYELLKPFSTKWPPGLSVYTQFLTADEERRIIRSIGPRLSEYRELEKKQPKEPWAKYYGFTYDVDDEDEDPLKPPTNEGFPYCTVHLSERLVNSGLFSRRPEQLTLTYYQPGHGLSKHVELHSAFEDTIAYLNLKAPVVMEFSNGNELGHILLPVRSLLVLKNEARLQWAHAISKQKFDIVADEVNGGVTTMAREPRFSLTFRMIRRIRQCFCKFPKMCDFQGARIIKKLELENNEKKLWMPDIELAVKIFEKSQPLPPSMSSKFISWPEVQRFIDRMNPTKALLEIGRDDGKYFNLQKYSYEACPGMKDGTLHLYMEQHDLQAPRFLRPKLPYENETFDGAICLAVLHHLNTKEMRLIILNEMMRVLKGGAEALIYAKARVEPINRVKSALEINKTYKAIILNPYEPLDRTSACHLKNYSFLPIHNHDYDFPENPRILPWAKGLRSPSALRILPTDFNQQDLENLVAEIEPRPKLISCYYDNGNWCARISKE